MPASYPWTCGCSGYMPSCSGSRTSRCSTRRARRTFGRRSGGSRSAESGELCLTGLHWCPATDATGRDELIQEGGIAEALVHLADVGRDREGRIMVAQPVGELPAALTVMVEERG